MEKKDLNSILGESKTTMNPCISISALLFKARNDAHITHLMQADKTLARHTAMNIFYDEILDKIDTLVETSMGLYPATDISVASSCKIPDPLSYFQNLYSTIDTERKGVKESFLQNQIDTIQEEISHCLYRLQYIKD